MKPYYEDDAVTLYHGDCRTLMPALMGQFGAIVSDPPYGMGYKHGARKGGVRLGHDGESIEGDDSESDSCLRARITVRKDGVVTKVVEVRGHRIDGDESAVCPPVSEADDAA